MKIKIKHLTSGIILPLDLNIEIDRWVLESTKRWNQKYPKEPLFELIEEE